VESGAAPEVVNLLVVAYWDGIIACDQSGRTPMEILDNSELLEQEESRVVFESLQRCFNAYTGFQKRTQDAINILQKKHKSTVIALKKKHDAEIQCEQEKQEEIRNEVRQLQSKIEELNGFIKARDEQISTFTNEQTRWLGRTRELASTTTDLKEQLSFEKETVEAFVDAVHSRDHIIAERDQEIERLSNDLRKIYLIQERDVAATLMQAERSMRAMVSTQIALQNQLLGETKGLKVLLQKRGIPVCDEGTNAIQGASSDDQEDELYDDDATNAVAAAAVTALQLPTMASA
jgi:chromosome segregation ATPase